MKARIISPLCVKRHIERTHLCCGDGGNAFFRGTPATSGPTRARATLYGHLPGGKGKDHVDGLDEGFATNLAALFQDAPPDIRQGLQVGSGFRSVERQRQLWEASDKSGKMVAAPGRSYHNHGEAVDIWYNGTRLDKAPANVREWVHQNASKYGLYFPMGYEPWHVEPRGTRGTVASGTVAPRNNRVAARSVMPSLDDIEGRLQNIADPKVRDLTRKRLYSAIEAQSKAAEVKEKAAKAEHWSYVDQGATPDQVPMEVRQGAGLAAVSSAWSYIETAAKGRAVESDETLLYDMRRYAAANPTEFSGVDLNDFRDRLSKETIKELTGLQTTALTDQRKAREEGLTLTTAFSQATSQLEAVGIRKEASKRIAQFQNALASEMETFKRTNDGKAPTQVDIQSMVNRLLLPVVMKQERGAANPLGWFGDSFSTTKGKFLFEAGGRSNASTADVVVEYADIPIDLRRSIALKLEGKLGRKPTPEEVVQKYEDFVLAQ